MPVTYKHVSAGIMSGLERERRATILGVLRWATSTRGAYLGTSRSTELQVVMHRLSQVNRMLPMAKLLPLLQAFSAICFLMSAVLGSVCYADMIVLVLLGLAVITVDAAVVVMAGLIWFGLVCLGKHSDMVDGGIGR
jgi:hypothetical protein